MAIRKIKAHEAVEDGDFIRIRRRSSRLLGALIGCIIGCVITAFLKLELEFFRDDFFDKLFIVSSIFAIVGLALSKGEEVRRVPKIDLVEIKKYSSGHVTVVLDDERSMRQRGNNT